jgi:hypothetical protein
VRAGDVIVRNTIASDWPSIYVTYQNKAHGFAIKYVRALKSLTSFTCEANFIFPGSEICPSNHRALRASEKFARAPLDASCDYRRALFREYLTQAATTRQRILYLDVLHDIYTIYSMLRGKNDRFHGKTIR